MRLSLPVLVLLFASACAHAPEPSPSPAPAPAAEQPTAQAVPPAEAEWRWVDASAVGARFQMPSSAKVDVENATEDTEAGPARTVTWALSKTNDDYLAVSVTAFPEGTMAESVPDDVLAGARDGSVANVNGTLLTDKSISALLPFGGKVPGREYTLTSDQEGVHLHMSARVYLRGDRLYQLIYVRLEESDEPFRKLAASFQFL